MALQRNIEIYRGTQTEESRLSMERHRGTAQGSLEAMESANATLVTLRAQLLLVNESIKTMQDEVLRSKLQAVGPSLESLTRIRQSIADTSEKILLKERAMREITAESDKTNKAITKFAMESSVARVDFMRT